MENKTLWKTSELCEQTDVVLHVTELDLNKGGEFTRKTFQDQ